MSIINARFAKKDAIVSRTIAAISVSPIVPPVNRPLPPAAVSVTPNHLVNIVVWSPVAAVDFYRVLRSLVDGGPYEVIVSGVTAQSYADYSVTPGTPYFYVVQSVSLTTGISDSSIQATGTPLNLLPGACTFSVEESLGDMVVSLLSASSGATSYILRAGDIESSATLIDTLEVGEFPYTDTTPVADVSTKYWLYAQNAYGLVPSTSNPQIGVVHLPGAFEMSADSLILKVSLGLVTTPTNVATYRITRDDVQIASGLTSLPYYDETGVVGQGYQYSIYAVNGAGATVSSNGPLQSESLPIPNTLEILTDTLDYVIVGVPAAVPLLLAGTPPFMVRLLSGAVTSGLALVETEENDFNTTFVTGTPAVGSEGIGLPITIEVSSGAAVASKTFDPGITCYSLPEITNATTIYIEPGEAGSYQLAALGYPAPTWTKDATSWPSGITINASGLISWTDQTANEDTITGSLPVTATNIAGYDTANIVFDIAAIGSPRPGAFTMSAVGAIGKVTLDRTASSGATGYRIERDGIEISATGAAETPSLVGAPVATVLGSTGTTCASPAFNAIAGNFIFVKVANSQTGGVDITGVTDTAGNTYTLAGDQTGESADNRHAIYYTATAITGNASNVVTATYAGTCGSRRVLVSQFSWGGAASVAYDAQAAHLFEGSAVTTHTSNAVTTSEDNELIISGWKVISGGGGTYSNSTSTILHQTDGYHALAYQFAPTAGSHTAQLTTSIAGVQHIIAKAFKPVAASTFPLDDTTGTPYTVYSYQIFAENAVGDTASSNGPISAYSVNESTGLSPATDPRCTLNFDSNLTFAQHAASLKYRTGAVATSVVPYKIGHYINIIQWTGRNANGLNALNKILSYNVTNLTGFKISIPWGEIESNTPEVYTWATLDAICARIVQAGKQFIILVQDKAVWGVLPSGWLPSFVAVEMHPGPYDGFLQPGWGTAKIWEATTMSQNIRMNIAVANRYKTMYPNNFVGMQTIWETGLPTPSLATQEDNINLLYPQFARRNTEVNAGCRGIMILNWFNWPSNGDIHTFDGIVNSLLACDGGAMGFPDTRPEKATDWPWYQMCRENNTRLFIFAGHEGTYHLNAGHSQSYHQEIINFLKKTDGTNIGAHAMEWPQIMPINGDWTNAWDFIPNCASPLWSANTPFTTKAAPWSGTTGGGSSTGLVNAIASTGLKADSTSRMVLTRVVGVPGVDTSLNYFSAQVDETLPLDGSSSRVVVGNDLDATVTNDGTSYYTAFSLSVPASAYADWSSTSFGSGVSIHKIEHLTSGVNEGVSSAPIFECMLQVLPDRSGMLMYYRLQSNVIIPSFTPSTPANMVHTLTWNTPTINSGTVGVDRGLYLTDSLGSNITIKAGDTHKFVVKFTLGVTVAQNPGFTLWHQKNNEAYRLIADWTGPVGHYMTDMSHSIKAAALPDIKTAGSNPTTSWSRSANNVILTGNKGCRLYTRGTHVFKAIASGARPAVSTALLFDVLNRDIIVPPPVGGTELFNVDFSSSFDPPFRTHIGGGGSFVITGGEGVSTSAGAGQYRSEIESYIDQNLLLVGYMYQIDFKMKKGTWTSIPSWNMVMQSHAVPSTWSYEGSRNPLGLSIEQDGKLGFRCIINQNTGNASGAAMAQLAVSDTISDNTWYDVKMVIKPSFGSDGLVEYWLNGVKRYTQDGPNFDLKDSGGFPTQGKTYLKFGMYRDDTNTGSQVMYYDNIKLTRLG